MYTKWLLLYVIGVHALFSDCALVSSKPKPCPTLRLARGRVKYFQKGKLARFQCNSGYILAGERYSPCIRGAWETETPVCVKPSCGTVKAPLNGLIYPQYQGAVLNFLCKPGYTLRGTLVTYCDGFSWTNNLPTCVATGSEPPMSCDFESVDLCGWQHDLNHNFDWRRYNFQTPSGHIGTGPRSDHTKGEGKDGYYMYIESSSRLENDTARLLSPVYNKMENGVCFTFYYHMFGTGMGSLLVYVKKQSQSYDTKYLTPEFVERGNQGEVWKRGAVSVPSVDEPFQIIIEGVRGKSYVSDIAIDDVSLAAAECEDNEFSTVSTTEEVSTEMAPMVESCLNRCDNSSDTIYLDSFVLACDCVDTCIENNSCCPDYVAVCILGSGTDFTESYDTSTNDYDHSTEPTVTDITRQRTSAATVPDRTTVEPGTTAESRTRYTGPYTGVWWMDTTTSRPIIPVIARRNSTVRPVITNRNTSALAPANTTVQPSITTAIPVTSFTRRWYNATALPRRSPTTMRPRITDRPYPTRVTNTTRTNSTNTRVNTTNIRPYYPVKSTNTSLKLGNDTGKTSTTNLRPYFPIKPSTSTVKPRINASTTNLRPYFPIKPSTSTVKPRINSSTTNLRPYFPIKPSTSTVKPRINSSTTNLRPYFPTKPTKSPLKPRIEGYSSTVRPKSKENDVIKPVLPTQRTKPPPPVSTTSLPDLPTERDDEISATLEMETDYVDTNSPQPVLFAQNESIIEAKPSATTPATHMIMGVLCGAVLVMLVALGVVLMARRRNWKLCRRFHGVRHSDSMSDVRFLASDEVLDFTWRSAHN